ncbi:hypothetical protein Dip510_001789 [Elusimicrobium posterum]|uniref:epoxyqueuosine reductase QueH n=1 Tax=Elusimicrobium posterum TaxID=3116653 RepID=UPI003C74CF9F
MNEKNKLLLLSCCAPCSCAVIEKLYNDGRDFTVLFYNPNIIPFEEYEKRKEENKKLCTNLGVNFVDLDYDNADWQQAIKGFEHTPERGERCRKCFDLRLKKAAAYAKENGYTALSSVLGVSRYKNLDDVNEIAKKAAAEFNILYDDTNWRKGGLEERRRALLKELEIYDQTHCGCQKSLDALLNSKIKKQSPEE